MAQSATLTPHFRDFLPSWMTRQSWYQGAAMPESRPVGFYRLEDPAGLVGIETHLIGDGSGVYQVPLTYRGAPLPELPDHALISTAEHSVLGPRWIYDATWDPVWQAELVRLVATEAAAASRGGARMVRGVQMVRGVRQSAWPAGVQPVIELIRLLAPGPPAAGPDVLGAVLGSWPAESGDGELDGCLAVLRAPR